jgi:hypothetical protein
LEDYGTNAAEGMLCETSRNLSHQDFWLHHERNVSVHVWQRWSWFGKGIWQVLVEGNDIQLSCVIETAIAVLTNTQVWCKCCVLLCLLFFIIGNHANCMHPKVNMYSFSRNDGQFSLCS